MAVFRAAVEQTWTTRAAPDAALAYFADLDQNIRHNKELDSYERLDPQTLRMVLVEQRSGRTTYTPRYTLRWSAEPAAGVLRWQTVPDGAEASMTIRGEARFTGPASGPTTVHWFEEVAADVPVNRIVAKAVAPVAEGLIRRGIRGFVDRMIASLDQQS